MLVSDSQQFCEPGQWVLLRQPLLSPVQQHHRVLLHLTTAPVFLAALLRVELQWFLRRYSAEPEPPDPRLAGAAVRRAARAEPEPNQNAEPEPEPLGQDPTGTRKV